MRKTTIFLAAVAIAFSAAAQAQTDVITGTMQEMPTTVITPPNPALLPPQGTVSIITVPNIPPGGVMTGPGPLPGTPQGGFVTLGAPPAPPTWTRSSGQTDVSTKGPSDNYSGRWICRANYNGIWFVGHRQQAAGKNMCVFTLGDKVLTADVAEMLSQFPNVPVRWLSLQGSQLPQGIFASDMQTGRGLPLCRTVAQGALTVGWADKSGIHVPAGDRGQYKAVVSPNFEIIALGEIRPKPPSAPSGPNINLGDFINPAAPGLR